MARGELRFEVDDQRAFHGVESVQLRLFYPLRADGTTLECDDLVALPYETPAGLNEVHAFIGNAADSLTVPAIPVSGERAFLALVQGYALAADSAGAHGDRTGEACVENLAVPAGDFADDAAHVRSIVLDTACGGGMNDFPCPDGLSCAMGLCRDLRCGTCAAGQACRRIDGVSSCHQRCDPANPDCPNRQRCDGAPGFPSVCLPVD